jgi:pimeloyl-ACP methyl ester carboxylesterase
MASTPSESAFFDSDGVKIHYETWGKGYPILLVHGFAASIAINWVAPGWVDALLPVRRVVAMDCRGHGLSGKPHEAAAYDGYKMEADVLNLMEHLGIGKADLFGYSMGSFVALGLLAHHPHRFSSVMLGGAGNVLEGLPPKAGQAISEALSADDAASVKDPTGLAFRLFASADRNNDLKALAACAGNPAPPIPASAFVDVDIPVLIVKGSDDDVTGDVGKTAETIPGARLLMIPGRDHLTVVGDQRFKGEVVTFLRQHSTEG